MSFFNVGFRHAQTAFVCLLTVAAACDPELDPAYAEPDSGDQEEVLASEAEVDAIEVLAPSFDDDEYYGEAYHASGLYYTLPAHGGGGGGPGLLACSAGYVAVGIYGASGVYLDRIGLACAALYDDGTLGPSYDTGTLGGTGGGSFRRMCPAGQAIVGFYGRSGTLVDQLGVYCSRVENWAINGTTQYTTGSTGGSGGGAFSDYCPREYVVARINVRTGALVDRIEPQCAYVYP